MQPDSISPTPPHRRAAWMDHPPVTFQHRVYRTGELYDCGLAGQTFAEAAKALAVESAVFTAALTEHPVLEQAYEAGWDKWEEESLRRTEAALAQRAEGYVDTVERVVVNKGVMTRYEEKVVYPPDPTSIQFKLERRARARFGKDVRVEAPSVGQAALEMVALHLIERGLGTVKGLPLPGTEEEG